VPYDHGHLIVTKELWSLASVYIEQQAGKLDTTVYTVIETDIAPDHLAFFYLTMFMTIS
jgi:hypothetical protein